MELIRFNSINMFESVPVLGNCSACIPTISNTVSITGRTFRIPTFCESSLRQHIRTLSIKTPRHVLSAAVLYLPADKEHRADKLLVQQSVLHNTSLRKRSQLLYLHNFLTFHQTTTSLSYDNTFAHIRSSIFAEFLRLSLIFF
eukprot:scpid37005/ scgid21929/ 